MKRIGFWRETLRPFLISACLFGIGGTTTGIAREWNCTYGSPEDCESEIDRFENEVADFDLKTGEALAIQAHMREAGRQTAVHAGPIRFGLEGQARRFHNRCVSDEGRVGLVSGLVLSSLSFLLLTFFTGGAPRSAQPFLRDGESGVDRPGVATPSTELKPDRSELVLILGMLSLVTFLFPLGIGAWVWGQRNLSEMRAGRMDLGGWKLSKAGMICGMVNVLVTVVGGAILLFVIISG